MNINLTRILALACSIMMLFALLAGCGAPTASTGSFTDPSNNADTSPYENDRTTDDTQTEISEDGGFLLAEAPYSDHTNLFSVQELSLIGRISKDEDGSYSLITDIPSGAGRIYDKGADYASNGGLSRFTVEPVFSETSNKTTLSMQFSGDGYRNTIATSALDLYTDKEFFAYLINYNHCMYLVTECIEYENIDIVGINYYYKPDELQRVVTESIRVVNLSTFVEFTISAEYDPSSTRHKYEETTYYPDGTREASLPAYQSRVLYYEYQSKDECGGELGSRTALVEYLSSRMTECGLSGRLYFEEPALSNATPVFSSKVIGDPKNINLKTQSDLSLTGSAWLGVTGEITTIPGGNSPNEDHSAVVADLIGTWYSKANNKVYILSSDNGLDLGFTFDAAITTSGSFIEINLNTDEITQGGFDVADDTSILLYKFDYTGGDGEFEQEQVSLNAGSFSKVSENLTSQLVGTWKSGENYIKFNEYHQYTQSIDGERKANQSYYVLSEDLMIVFDSGKYKQINYFVSGNELHYGDDVYSLKK